MTVTRGSSLFSLAVIVSLLTLSSTTLLAQADPMLGTWKLNLAKSKYNPGPAPKSETRIYVPSGANGVKATFNRVDAAGKPVTITYTAMYDGKDYKYSGSPDADTIALKRLDPNHTEATLKRDGKVVQTTKATVSADGKVRTLITTGINATGQTINNELVFDKA